MMVSTDDVHDVVAFPKLVAETEKRGRVSEALDDGAYDSGDVFMMLEERGVGAVIKPRRNSVLDTPSPARKRAVRRLRDLGYEAWAKLEGYGRRWMAETAFSAFKRLFGEHSMARSLGNVARELVAKVALYNRLVNL